MAIDLLQIGRIQSVHAQDEHNKESKRITKHWALHERTWSVEVHSAAQAQASCGTQNLETIYSVEEQTDGDLCQLTVGELSIASGKHCPDANGLDQNRDQD